MRRVLFVSAMTLMMSSCVFAQSTVFDSMDKAVEVKMKPQTTQSATQPAVNTQNQITKLQEQKFTSAISSLDDAQVELRQQLTSTTAKYNSALAEKKSAIEKCRTIKKELRAINKKMKNIEKSKKMINANLSTINGK
ncbi:hypothetical protein IJ670_04220 [bacterium]|nr:hypothetical protein [bacterium]